MPSYYPLLSLLSMVAFAGLGYYLASQRNRNRLGWAIIGIFFPPLLLLVLFLGERKDEESGADDTGGELDES